MNLNTIVLAFICSYFGYIRTVGHYSHDFIITIFFFSLHKHIFSFSSNYLDQKALYITICIGFFFDLLQPARPLKHYLQWTLIGTGHLHFTQHLYNSKS